MWEENGVCSRWMRCEPAQALSVCQNGQQWTVCVCMCAGENFMQTTNKLAHSSEHMRLHLVAPGWHNRAHIHRQTHASHIQSRHTRDTQWHSHTFSDVIQIYLSVNLCSMLVAAMHSNAMYERDVLRPSTLAARPTDWTSRRADEHMSKRVNCTLKWTIPFAAIKCVRASGLMERPTQTSNAWRSKLERASERVS